MPKLAPSSGGGGGSSELLAPGEYVIALSSFSRKTSSKNKEYLRCLFEVCGGTEKGKKFWSSLALDISKPGTATRWQILMEQCDVVEEFEIGSHKEGNASEGDRNIARLFKGKPFVARIKKEVNGQYTNNDIEQLVFRKLWTEEQKDMMFDWMTERNSRGNGGGGGQSPEDSAGDPGGSFSDGTDPSSYDDQTSYDPAAGAADDGDFDPRTF